MGKKIVLILFTFIYSTLLFSMGGDKPGPNGGHITMPGTYHVELVDKGNEFRIYLLDLSMKNPITKKSNASINNFHCRPIKNYFSCLKTEIKFDTIKKIIVDSTRNDVKAKNAEYQLPLMFN